MIISRTPYRISLAGGGTDFPEWVHQYPSKVLSFAFNKYSFLTFRKNISNTAPKFKLKYSVTEEISRVEMIKHPLIREAIKFLNYKDGFELHHDTDLPTRSGIGSSSSFLVGLIKTLMTDLGKKISNKELAEITTLIERDLVGDRVGYQDPIPAAFGGLNSIEFFSNSNKVSAKVENIDITVKKQKQLESSINLVYSGIQRNSSAVHTKSDIVQNTNFKTYEKLMLSTYNLAKRVESIFQLGSDLEEIADVFNLSWDIKVQLNSESMNSELLQLKNFGFSKGATGAKVLGSGGGGFIAFWVPEKNQSHFYNSFDQGRITKVKFDKEGSKIIYDDTEDNSID